jgi:hypothetical protein
MGCHSALKNSVIGITNWLSTVSSGNLRVHSVCDDTVLAAAAAPLLRARCRTMQTPLEIDEANYCARISAYIVSWLCCTHTTMPQRCGSLALQVTLLCSILKSVILCDVLDEVEVSCGPSSAQSRPQHFVPHILEVPHCKDELTLKHLQHAVQEQSSVKALTL